MLRDARCAVSSLKTLIERKVYALDKKSLEHLNEMTKNGLAKTMKAMAEFEMDSDEVRYTGIMTHEDRNHIVKRPFMDTIVAEDHR